MSDIIAVQNLLTGGEQQMIAAESEEANVKLKWRESPAYRAAAVADLEALKERMDRKYEDDPQEGHREFSEMVANDPRLFRAAVSKFVDANIDEARRLGAKKRKRRI